MTPIMRPAAPLWAPPRLPFPRLAQARPDPFRVVVTDVRGTPFRGVSVAVSGAGQAVTDAEGTASFGTPPSPEADVTLRIGDLVSRKHARTDETLFVQLPICAPPRLLTNTEIVAILVGGSMTGAGLYWNVQGLQIVGEIVLGGALFTAIYRHSCNW